MLKPCPFCGDVPILERTPLWSQGPYGSTHEYYGCYEYDVRCHNPSCRCSVLLPKSDTIYNTDEEAKQNAIDAWNRRFGEEE